MRVTTSVAEFNLDLIWLSFMIYVIIIKHAKLSDSSIESQLIPCAPACSYKFCALAVYLHPTFTAPFRLEVHLESSQASAVELFCENSRTQSWLFDRILSVRRSFPSLGLHKEILDSPYLIILLIYTKRKTKTWKIGLTTRPHFIFLKLSKCSKIPHPSPRMGSTPNRTKTNHHWLNHLKILYTH